MTEGRPVITSSCADAERRKFFNFALRDPMTSKDAADMGFASFAACQKKGSGKKGCYMTRDLNGTTPADFRFGFHAGAGQGHSPASLDFAPTSAKTSRECCPAWTAVL